MMLELFYSFRAVQACLRPTDPHKPILVAAKEQQSPNTIVIVTKARGCKNNVELHV